MKKHSKSITLDVCDLPVCLCVEFGAINVIKKTIRRNGFNYSRDGY